MAKSQAAKRESDRHVVGPSSVSGGSVAGVAAIPTGVSGAVGGSGSPPLAFSPTGATPHSISAVPNGYIIGGERVLCDIPDRSLVSPVASERIVCDMPDKVISPKSPLQPKVGVGLVISDSLHVVDLVRAEGGRESILFIISTSFIPLRNHIFFF